MPVAYHFALGWDGVPENAHESGWHVLGLRQSSVGAETGVMVFLSWWRADRRCWGSEADHRPPSWAVAEGLHYVCPAPGADARIRMAACSLDGRLPPHPNHSLTRRGH